MTLTRAERDQFTATTPTDIAYGEGACLETPPGVFKRLNERFAFDVDLTANEHNHLVENWYGPGSPFHDSGFNSYQDALSCDWGAYGRWGMPAGFSNPPYGPFIPKILKKAIEERDKGFTSVFLLPLRAGGWYQDLVLPYYSELWHCASRLMFHYQGKPRLSAAAVATKAFRADLRYACFADGTIVANERVTIPYVVDGVTYTYDFGVGQKIMTPAGALFDSIIVVFKPYDRSKWGLFPPPQRPNVWDPRTGELRY